MGNLHEGHLGLFNKAPKDTLKVASIYVNPLQFNDDNDYIHYPRSLDNDLDKCKECGDLVYTPHSSLTQEIHPEKNVDLQNLPDICAVFPEKIIFEVFIK